MYGIGDFHVHSTIDTSYVSINTVSVCLSGCTQGTLYTTTTVYGLLVHQEGAICTMVHKGDYVF